MDVSVSSNTGPDNGLPEVLRTTARRLLAETGAGGLTLDAVARAGGLSPAEVTAVFAHRDDLLTALLVDAYDESASAMEQADREAVENGATAGARFLAVTRALRAWSVANPAVFTLVYGSPVPGYHAPMDTVAPASRTPAVLAGIVRAALEAGELTPPRRAFAGPPLVRPEAVELFGGLPDAPYADVIERGIVLWSNLVGLLVFEVFSRTHDSVADQVAFFDYAVAVAAESVGLVVPPGADRRR
ncbi:TetR/AcrR family transcriptional regulator [Streptomyces sp. UNOC14_S4]|uniref:TetR/AcrR family transcriptional regulator n=1 Tax=Streptomyces sp. UNOC14_S4 TaxID=2872340 RepID=UPI001E2B006F|nr:TetR-like C-terminal domain-containing protein [Streptomyces sp. UNOC14_S4]MCC3768065.1 WHG domain-containing protein [Streptomyces sp. UNOC14_S4]